MSNEDGSTSVTDILNGTYPGPSITVLPDSKTELMRKQSDALNRIATALERIADAYEEQEDDADTSRALMRGMLGD
ncbi:hypothetical protein [Bifidobacterium cuniculi]|uniref:Uncharacterized protein n=1 Tax=Bifidobacterium cuniculi TaxID=1688 RepID=A0A087B514_9BIFI|nr:hypothetical protein [Bifidobacterium cuniculi]KFI66114.1 hypothetical protein BCUN_0618 [Bifidobacterium cuniculi]